MPNGPFLFALLLRLLVRSALGWTQPLRALPQTFGRSACGAAASARVAIATGRARRCSGGSRDAHAGLVLRGARSIASVDQRGVYALVVSMPAPVPVDSCWRCGFGCCQVLGDLVVVQRRRLRPARGPFHVVASSAPTKIAHIITTRVIFLEVNEPPPPNPCATAAA